MVNLQVSDAKEFVIEVRLLVSSSTSPRAWDLRCEMREKMIVWLNAEHPYALPRHRADIIRQEAPKAEAETRAVFRQRVPKRSAEKATA